MLREVNQTVTVTAAFQQGEKDQGSEYTRRRSRLSSASTLSLVKIATQQYAPGLGVWLSRTQQKRAVFYPADNLP